MLWMLTQMASGGGPVFVISAKDGSQDARPVGGMGAIYRPIASELAETLYLSQPVRSIAQDADGVTVRADHLTVRARRAIERGPQPAAATYAWRRSRENLGGL
ncbi:amine oxidase (flavin-containing) [Mycobacteroides abscessus subsp. massiliense]|nr:amine oxidase (flavin-containing) [Mycobacteroides abscessus subsp. massiliense]